MGLDSNVLCIGMFSEEIVDCLNYGPEFYEGITPGTIITATLLDCNTTDQSRQLAEALNTAPWDFERHCINKENVKWEDLRELSECCAEWDETDVEKFRRLLDAEFFCIYQPNG
jgi:hypothetical protein